MELRYDNCTIILKLLQIFLMDNILNNVQLKKKAGVLIIFILLGLGLYFNSLQNGFHYDDQHHIVRNVYIQSPGNIPLFFTEHRMFSALSGVFLHYRPLVMVSYALNYYFGKLDPAGYHLVNLAFHVGSAFLLFLIVNAMTVEGLEVRSKSPLSSLFPPIAAGLLFLTTPFNSEVINYVTARSSVMCSFFMLLSFYLWMKFRSQNTSIFYLYSFLAFLLAMLTKEVAIMLPVMFLLYDVYFSRIFARFDYRAIVSYVPFGIAGIFIGFVIRLVYFKSTSLYSALSLEKKPVDSEFVSNVIIAVKVLAKYSYSIFVPVQLSIWHKVEESPDIFFIISFLLVTAILASAILLWRRSDHLGKRASFFILWFFVMLLPMTMLSLTAPYQENRGHIAAAGLIAAVVIGLAALIEKLGSGRSLKGVIYAMILTMIILYSAGTVKRNNVWLNDMTLWTDVSAKYPDSVNVRSAIGLAHQSSGNREAAESEFLEILKKDPQNRGAYANLGIIYYGRGELDKSLEFFLKAEERDQFDPTTNVYLAKIYKEKGDMPSTAKHLLMLIAISPHNIAAYQELAEVYIRMGEAEKFYGMMSKAIAEDPNNVGAYRALGLVSLRRGDQESAQKAFEKVFAYMPTNQDVLLDLGYLYGSRGMFARSEDMFKRVVVLSPNDAEAMQALGSIYQRQGKSDEALAAYQNVLNNNPEQFTSYNNLGLLFFSMKNAGAAKAAFEKALGQNPNDLMARFNLARVYEVQGRKDLARKEFQRVVKETSGDKGNGKLYEVAQKKLIELQ